MTRSANIFYREAAVSLAQSAPSPFDSIPKYEQLQAFVDKVTKACVQVEDASGQQTLRLVSFLENILDRTWNDIKGGFTSYVTISLWLGSTLTSPRKGLWYLPQRL